MSQQINLYNPAFIPKRELLTGKNLAIAAAAVYGAIAAAAGWAYLEAQRQTAANLAAQQQLKQAQAATEAVRQASETRKPSAALQAEIDRHRQLMAMRDEVLAVAGQGLGGERGAGFGDYLAGLSRQSREGLWLTGFTVSAGGSGMVLRGRTVDKSLLPDYVRRLNREPAFAGRSFAGLQLDYREPGAAAPASVPPASTPVSPAPASAGPPRFLEFQLLAENAASTPAERAP